MSATLKPNQIDQEITAKAVALLEEGLPEEQIYDRLGGLPFVLAGCMAPTIRTLVERRRSAREERRRSARLAAEGALRTAREILQDLVDHGDTAAVPELEAISRCGLDLVKHGSKRSSL